MHAIKAFRADVLRGHRGRGHSHGECGHHDVVPQLKCGAERCSRLRSKTVDQTDHYDRRAGQHDHLQAHRQTFLDERGQDRAIRAQEPSLIGMQEQRVPPMMQITDQRDETRNLRNQCRRRRPCDAHARERPAAEDQQRIQHDVERDREQQEPEWRLRVAGAAQHHHHERIQKQEWNSREDDAQIGDREWHRVIGRLHKLQKRPCGDCARRRDCDRTNDEEARAIADDALCLLEIARADALPNQDRRRHSNAEHQRNEEKQNRVGIRRCRERGFAEIVADPDGVNRPVQRLQHVRCEDRQREEKQCPGNRALGQRIDFCIRCCHV